MTNAKNFQQNAAMAGGMPNGVVNGGMQPGVMPPGQGEFNMPDFGLAGHDGFNQMIPEFSMNNDAGGDVLDNFDFDAFLQDTDNNGAMGGFDNFDFGGGEVDGLGQ